MCPRHSGRGLLAGPCRFFFVEKKDGGLYLCIDHSGLNAVTVKYPHSFPLVPSASRCTLFTKLDLRGAYNLLCICTGNEWKTACSTTLGHYEYNVMPYELANAPFCFRVFFNNVFRDMLNCFAVVYIDDILIYSKSYIEHITHVKTVCMPKLRNASFTKPSSHFSAIVLVRAESAWRRKRCPQCLRSRIPT